LKTSLYSRYPIALSLEDLSKLLAGGSISVGDLIEQLKNYGDRALSRLECAVRGAIYKPYGNLLDDVSTFYLAVALAQQAHGWLLRRLADHEGKRVSSEIMKERDRDVVNILKLLGIDVEYIGEEDGCGHRVILGKSTSGEVVACYPYRTTIPRYLKYADKLLTEPSWKLVNRYVLKGYVYLSKKDLARLAEESVKKRILEYASAFSEPFIRDALGDYIEKARSLVPRQVIEREKRAVPEKVEKAFPPCIASLREALRRGEHLSHHQRFALATFMLSIGYSVDEVVDAFRTSPDFDEKVARYQIEHLAGLRGSRKKYLVYSCEKMKSLGMCVANCGTKTPLQYYRRTARGSETQ
jgi:DNA primase large subunit